MPVLAINPVISVLVLYHVIRNAGLFYLTFNICKSTINTGYSMLKWVFTKKQS